MSRRAPRVAVIAATLLATAIAVSSCGGGKEGLPAAPPVAANSDPGAPEFGEAVARIPGLAPSDVAAAAILTAYPPPEDDNPEGWILFDEKDWRLAAAAAPFAASPVDAALMPIKRRFLPTAASDLIDRIKPKGFPNGEGLDTMIVGGSRSDVIGELQDADLKTTTIGAKTPTEPAKTPAELVAELSPFRGGWAESYSDTVAVVSEDAREFAQPALAWSAFSGDTVVFVNGDGVPRPTARLLEQREKLRLVKPTIYLMGPESVISADVAKQLGVYGPVVRMKGATPVELALELAQFQDKDTAFGWGLDKGPANLAFVNSGEPGDLAAALNLAAAGPRAAMILLDSRSKLPPAVQRYLKRLQRNPGSSQGFVIGDRQSISSPLLAEIDSLLTKGKLPGEKGPAGGKE